MNQGPSFDDDTRDAFLFKSEDGEWLAATLDKDGDPLPGAREQQWSFIASFRLGVREAVPVNMDPEPILRGVKARGFYLWRAKRILPTGTSQ